MTTITVKLENWGIRTHFQRKFRNFTLNSQKDNSKQKNRKSLKTIKKSNLQAVNPTGNLNKKNE
jgi:hypothetical protein